MKKIALSLALLASLAAAPISRATPLPPGGAPDGGPVLGARPADSPNGHLFDWNGTPRGIAGRRAYDNDEVIITDYPFDDTGADLDGSDGRSDNPTELYSLLQGANAATGQAGDFVYPAGPYASNAADIVEVRVGLGESSWYVLIVFNAMIDAERTAYEAILNDPNLDVAQDPTLLVHGETGLLDGQSVDVAADAEQNTIEVEIPFSVLDPTGRRFDVFLGAGIWGENDWIRPSPDLPPYFDLASVPNGSETSYWNDVLQSRHLTDGEYLQDSFHVDFDQLAGTCDDCVEIIDCPGFCWGTMTRVFRSGQSLGEGVEIQTLHNQQEQGFGYRYYRSQYQPYSLYVPQTVRTDRPVPLVLLLHFLGGNYMSYPITSLDTGLSTWADELGVIVAMPHGRGEAGWYEGPAEKDVFEVWRDVARHYSIDRERVYLAGMSMGGFGTWRLGALYPDQFAAGIVWSGPMTPYSIWPYPVPVTAPRENPPMCARYADGCGYNLMDVMGNLKNLPMYVVHGGLDELVPSTGAENWMTRFNQVGGSYRYLFYPARRHETSYPGTTQRWVREWLGDLPERQRVPVHVAYTVGRDYLQPEHGIEYDGAYWVSRMHLIPEADEGTVRGWLGSAPTSLGIVPRGGMDELGPFYLRGRDLRWRLEDRTGITVTLENIDAVTLDALSMDWGSTERRLMQINTRVDAEVVVAGNFPPATELEFQSGDVTGEVIDGSIYLHVAAGGGEVSIDPNG